MMSSIRITVSKETVKELVKALQKAYKSGDARMIKRISALLDFSRGDTVEEIAQRHGVSLSSMYVWIKKLLVEGVAGLKPRWKGGRPPKLTKSQKKALGQMIDAGLRGGRLWQWLLEQCHDPEIHPSALWQGL
jgi:transposase